MSGRLIWRDGDPLTSAGVKCPRLSWTSSFASEFRDAFTRDASGESMMPNCARRLTAGERFLIGDKVPPVMLGEFRRAGEEGLKRLLVPASIGVKSVGRLCL